MVNTETVKTVNKKEIDRLINDFGDGERLETAQRGFFVVTSDRSGVYCPNGEKLYRKSTKKDGRVRYCSKGACPKCPSPCFQRSDRKTFKEIDFSPLVSIKGDEKLLLEILRDKGLL